MPDETVGDRIVRIAASHPAYAGLTRKALAEDIFSVSYETLRKWLQGDSAPSRSRAEKIAATLGVPPETFMHGVEYDRNNATSLTPGRGVAHDLSQIAETLDVQTVDWGDLVVKKLPTAFSLVIRDDAMAPLLNKGDVARFSTVKAVAPGKRVLVADRDGHAYIREYRVRRGELWQAVALNPAYEAMDSTADGLRVLAVMTGLDWE